MALVPICDEYTDPTLSGSTWFMHTPIPLGNGKVVLTTEKSTTGPIMLMSSADAPLTPQARVYTLTSTGYTRSDPVTCFACTHARAATATLDGRVVMQFDGGFHEEAITNYWILDPATGPALEPAALVGGIDGRVDGVLQTPVEAMTRVPSTNYIWSWRYYNTTGRAYMDVLLAQGSTLTVMASVEVEHGDDVTFVRPELPRRIVPVGRNEAISVLAYPDRLKIYHFERVGATILVTSQTITGYPHALDATVYPGLNCDAEIIVAASANSWEQVRLGITWAGGAFAISALPLTALPVANRKPAGYTGTALLPLQDGARVVVADGAIVIARPFRYESAEANYVHLTQYDQSTGAIVATVWTKGEVNAARTEQVSIDLALGVDARTGYYVLAGTETYTRGAFTDRANRLGIYRSSYVLDDARRSQREAFER